MRRSVIFVTMLAIILVCAVGFSATKEYQFTGVVKTVDKDGLTVEKNAKEIWTFSTDGSTKGSPKVGDRVTVHYKMVATDIEGKAAPAKK